MATLLAATTQGATTGGESPDVRNWEIWRTPPIRAEGFQFEIQISSLGTAYTRERVEASIHAHDLGEFESAVSATMAAEWGYSFTHLDGQVDGAGRRIQAGFPEPPGTRADCLPVIEAFLQRQYIAGANRPWASMNGHYPWHHYAGEFGFDQLGSEIGENINNYQWHFALNRGAARQYRRPWFVDFSAWHGPSITDYSTPGIWGEYSGPDHGHSMSLFERSLFAAYMAGAGQVTAEAGGAIAFLPDAEPEGGPYRLSPYGEVCRRFRAFTRACPEVGVPITPIGILLDRHHGAYPGFGERRAFHHFPYGPGDQMTWDLIDLIWPGGWEVMGKDEVGTLVNGPFGDVFDVILQNAAQPVLDSYPCLLLAGDLQLGVDEVERLMRYAAQGGTLLVNTAHLMQLPGIAPTGTPPGVDRIAIGQGCAVIYGPDHDVSGLPAVLHALRDAHLPVRVEGGVQYMVNRTDRSVLVTLINNAGIRKAPREPAVVDATATKTAVISRPRPTGFTEVVELTGRGAPRRLDGERLEFELPPGGIRVVEIRTASPEN